MNVSAWLEAHCLCHVRQRYALDWATGLVCLAIAAASLETLLTEYDTRLHTLYTHPLKLPQLRAASLGSLQSFCLVSQSMQ